MLSAALNHLIGTMKDSAAIAGIRAQLELFKAQVEDMERKLNESTRSNAVLAHENSKLKALVAEQKAAAAFKDLGVCYAKESPDGGFFPYPFCPKCRMPMSQDRTRSDKAYACSGCRAIISYSSIASAINTLFKT